MITVETAAELIKKYAYPMDKLGTLADILSDRDYPPFNRVMMDGIAINFSELEKGRGDYRIEGIAAAGDPLTELKNVQGCLEVMTGAPMPIGTDCVIQYEHLNIENGYAHLVVKAQRARFDSVHFEGSDCKKGDVVLKAGSFLNGPHTGIAASMGQLSGSAKPKIMIISTGDELVEVDQTPLTHQIRRSNAHALKASLVLNGFTDCTLDHLKDDAEIVATHYEKFAPHFDLMIYSGGVSKGKFDYLPGVWESKGVTKHFHEVSQRPGKPLWFGIDAKRAVTVVGLPGNPVSSLVCLHRYILPQRLMYARLTEEVVFKKPLTSFIPVKINFTKEGVMTATPLKIKNSGEFTALAGSDGFIELPKDQSVFKSGESFSFYSWRTL
jgi:molybdopterin molybdotransferase